MSRQSMEKLIDEEGGEMIPETTKEGDTSDS